MDQLIIDQLNKQYDVNVRRATELAVNSVVNIEIPVVNTLSTLPRYQLIQILHNIKNKFKDFSSSEQSFFMTLLTDVVTCMIKYNDFYESFQSGNNSYIVSLLCDKIRHMARIKKQEFNQILKYANRIPDYPDLKICLNHIMAVNNVANNNFTLKHHKMTINQSVVKTILEPVKSLPPINNNTIVDTPEKYLSAKGMYIGENKLNKGIENIGNVDKTNKVELECKENEKINLFKFEVNFTENKFELVKAPEIKPETKELDKGKRKNVFDILMNAARNKKTKLF